MPLFMLQFSNFLLPLNYVQYIFSILNAVGWVMGVGVG